MDKDMNIMEKGKLAKKAEDIKVSLDNGMYQAKKIFLKGISLGTALSIIMSSVAFGGTHYVSNWDDYKRAIVEDIMKQDREIIIYYKEDGLLEHYTEEDIFNSRDEIKKKVKDLYEEAREPKHWTPEDKNVWGTEISSSHGKFPNEEKYVLRSATYVMTYYASAEEFEFAQEVIDNFIANNITEDMSDYEKVKAIYEFVIENYKYGFVTTGDEEQNQRDERNIWLGLQGKPVVCEAYAILFAKMITELGYNNMIISGKAGNPPEGHAWNLVEINGQWYHVDPTWGDDEEDGVDYKYLLTSDEFIENKESSVNSRTWDRSKYPEAPEVYNEEEHIERELGKQVEKLGEQIQGLGGQLQELRDEVQGLNNLEEVESLRVKIQGFKGKVEELRDEVQPLRDKIEALSNEDKKHDLNNRLDATKISLINIENNLNIALNDLEQKETELINTLLQEAIEAVELAEKLVTQESVNYAKDLVNKLPNGEEENELNNRLDVVQDAIDTKEELERNIKEIENAIKNMTDLSETDDVQKAIDELPNGEDKDILQNDLNSKIQEIEELQQQIQEAIIAVELAENTKIQKDIDFAMNLVNQLIDNELKESLLDRLNAIELEKPEGPIEDEEPEDKELEEKIKEANLLVEKAETTRIQEDINLAIDLVNELPDGEIKDKLINRLEAIEVIDEEPEDEEPEDKEPEDKEPEDEEPEDEEPEDEEPEDEEPEEEEPEDEEPEDEEPEGEQVQGLRDKVLRIEEQVQGFEGQVQGLRVEDVNSIEDIKRLRGDVQGLREQIQGLREKVQIIEVEIQDLAKGGYDLGDLYLSLGDLNTSLATLGNDLNSISILLDEKEAELELINEQIEEAILAVEKAETTRTQENINLAMDLVNELPDGEIKDELINRLEAIEVIVEEPEEDLDEDKDEEEEKEAEEESPEDNDEDDENKEPTEDETDEEDKTREDNSDENEDEKSEVEPEDEEPKEEEKPSRPIINRPERPIVREDEKKEDKPVVKNETREDVKSEEENRKENLKISKEKINELNAILRIIPNVKATITVGNIEIKPDVKPYIYKEKEEKILVPIRFVAEALGFEVNWSKATWGKGIKKVFLSYEGKGIVMEIGKDMAYVNGKPVKMDIAPELKNNRTYISLDFIVEILEANFNYNNIGNDIFFNIF